jgi:hypothetical protein
MEGDWVTYREAAERLGSTAEAIRYRALRGKWPRRRGNDGRARVQLPDEPNPVRTPSAQPVRTPSEPRVDQALMDSLREHVASLKAENETLRTQLAGAEGRAAAESARANDESAKTAQAIAAFEGLAQRLEAMAEARRPWWRRVVGG